MVKNSFIFNFKKMPLAFLLALVVGILFESCNAWFDRYLYAPPYDSMIVYVKNEIPFVHKCKYDYLVLGDCHAEDGFMPTVIDKKTGLSGFNFADGTQQTIFYSYCFLKHYLETCTKKPKYLILSFLRISSNVSKEKIEKEGLINFYDFKNNNELLLIKEFGFNKAYIYLIPSLKHLYLLSDWYEGFPSLRSILKNLDQIDPAIKAMWAVKGRHEPPYDPNFKDGKLMPILEKFEATDFFDKYMRSILDLAQDNNIKVIYSIPTDYDDYFELEKADGDVDAYINYLVNLRKEKHNLVIFYPELDLESTDLYQNHFHLNYYGAQILSDNMADKINELEGKH